MIEKCVVLLIVFVILYAVIQVYSKDTTCSVCGLIIEIDTPFYEDMQGAIFCNECYNKAMSRIRQKQAESEREDRISKLKKE